MLYNTQFLSHTSNGNRIRRLSHNYALLTIPKPWSIDHFLYSSKQKQKIAPITILTQSAFISVCKFSRTMNSFFFYIYNHFTIWITYFSATIYLYRYIYIALCDIFRICFVRRWGAKSSGHIILTEQPKRRTKKRNNLRATSFHYYCNT